MDRFDKMAVLHRVIPSLLFALGILGLPAPCVAQVPPGEAWETLETEHFRITYPEELLSLGQRAGQRAEVAWEALASTFVRPPKGKVDLVVTDHADISNGFTRIFPSNRIVIFAPPPVDGFGLPFMDEWLELVITHELVHVFHQDLAKNLGGALRKIFGRVPLEWPFFPGAATPGWVTEGIATYYESELTQAGRVRGSFHEMVVRTATLEGMFESIDQSAGDSPAWPGGQRYYVYGSLFLKHLMDRHGSEAMGAFVEAVAGQWVPYRMNAAAQEVLGVPFSSAWEEWRSGLEHRYTLLRDSLEARAPITGPELLTREGYYAWSPEPSPDGRWVAFSRSDGRSDPQIRLIDPERPFERKLARTNNLSNFSWLPSGQILFSQLNHTDSYRIRSDLFLADPDGDVRRITKGGRIDHPDVAPGGELAVAVQEMGGSNRLVMVDLRFGTVTPLTNQEDHIHWSYPRWSPDGQWIAVSRWRAGAHLDLVLLDSDGALRWEVTEDRGIDNAPGWSPDGRWLLWSSDRSGIPNLYASSVNPETGEPGFRKQITNMLGGAAYPSVSPDGALIYFSSYHGDGWYVARIPFEPELWFDPFPLHSRFLGQIDATRFEARVEAQGRAYDPFSTLRPTYWTPTYAEGDISGGVEVLQPGYGIFTSGEDLVGRHSFSLSGTVAGGVGTFSGRGSYTYSGFENPGLGVFAAQSYDAGSRPLRGITEGGDTVPLFLVEKERAVGVSATFFRIRSRTSSALSLSLSHIWEDRFLLEESLERSGRFRLTRPNVRLAEGRATLSFGNARRFSFSLSPEDGISTVIRARLREDISLADSLSEVVGSDRSFRDLVGRFVAYRGSRGRGFGNHVFGFRASGGVAGGPGADGFHFEVGGASGANLPVDFLDLGQSLLFPVRGFPTATRFGRYAWSSSLEYRFPIKLVNRGPGLIPIHLNWLGGTVFVDAGNAWGPELEVPGFFSPRGDALLSVGGEVLARVLPLWFKEMDVRVGGAKPLEGYDSEATGGGMRWYLRLGLAF